MLVLPVTPKARKPLQPVTPKGAVYPDKDAISTEKKGRPARLVTVKKWNKDWLGYEEEDGMVTRIWCNICKVYPAAAIGRQHDGQRQLVDCDAFIKGTTNVKRSAVNDHERADGHEAARLSKLAASQPENTPIS